MCFFFRTSSHAFVVATKKALHPIDSTADVFCTAADTLIASRTIYNRSVFAALARYRPSCLAQLTAMMPAFQEHVDPSVIPLQEGR